MLLALPCVAILSEEERAIVIGDFQRARQHLLLVFTLKFSHWRQLPWVIMGAAHPDLATARSCARRALSLYATAAPAVRAHPAVRMLCAPGSLLFQDMANFANGIVDWVHVPALLAKIAPYRFVPIAERWVEALHASAKKMRLPSPHYSPVHLAWKSIQTRIRRLLAAQAGGALIAFAKHALAARNPRLALIRMGFWRHPGVQAKLRSQGGHTRAFGRHLRAWVVQLLYHADSDTLFQDIHVGCKTLGFVYLESERSNLPVWLYIDMSIWNQHQPFRHLPLAF